MGQHVRIGVEGDGNISVSKHLRNHLGVDILGKEQRRAGMPEIMEAHGVGETSSLEEGFEVAAVEVVAIDGRAKLRGEDQPVVLPESLQRHALLKLSLAVTLQCLHRSDSQLDGSAALGGLRGREVALVQSAPDLELAAFEVDILPFEAQKLTLPQARRNGQHVHRLEPVAASCIE